MLFFQTGRSWKVQITSFTADGRIIQIQLLFHVLQEVLQFVTLLYFKIHYYSSTNQAILLKLPIYELIHLPFHTQTPQH